MKVTIVGFGFVGESLYKLLVDQVENMEVWDPAKGWRREAALRGRDIAFVCVPTPMKANGECDTSIVEQVIQEIDAKLIVIKSTVTPGTTSRLAAFYGRRIVFSPEYMGESRYYVPDEYLHPTDMRKHGFMIVGGFPEDCETLVDFFLPILGPTCRFRCMGSIDAELVKYAENSYFAMKVAFANELRRLCDTFGAFYPHVREGWLDDPRVGPMHTAAFKGAPGFSGKCLPKDISALAHAARQMGTPSILLDAIIAANKEHQS